MFVLVVPEKLPIFHNSFSLYFSNEINISRWNSQILIVHLTGTLERYTVPAMIFCRQLNEISINYRSLYSCLLAQFFSNELFFKSSNMTVENYHNVHCFYCFVSPLESGIHLFLTVSGCSRPEKDEQISLHWKSLWFDLLS